ncbi:flavin reductase (DIM6/NTAB) family NADH-FMN oxidoreductase RutF [Amycolatopsis sulphurea]|uniref:Flavin reductase (DIM6/NTAB) family NADH-FMN oxidoreductase RutF n=1 Tax=Amycolatopsis sulphurea TaxID=76022 RepID=A0A2A9FGN3_9PSEU|nr:flavin reductase family protein [Amycolatopsis sulphurea]PFG49926.1 flavin reductase (DIM6/NTAB) family NADH-FMN oxidoreductase RutF [Amycolatopsis sulphurea]
MIELESVTGDPVQLRRAYGCFPSGVTAVCAWAGGVPVGIAASSFTSVSVDPPLVSLCVQNSSTTWPRLRTAPRLGVSVLGQDQNGAVAWLDCSIHSEVPAGDHAIVLLRIHALRAEPDDAPLVFHGSRFRQLAAV